MELQFTEVAGMRLAEPADAHFVIRSEKDALELVGNASFAHADAVLLREAQLAPEFFDLSTGLAGELNQKLVNYRLLLAVVGRPADSASLDAFVRECRRGGPLVFADDREPAIAELRRRFGPAFP